MYRDTTNAENGMYDYTSNTWSLQNSKKGSKLILETTARNIKLIYYKRRLNLECHIKQKVLQPVP